MRVHTAPAGDCRHACARADAVSTKSGLEFDAKHGTKHRFPTLVPLSVAESSARGKLPFCSFFKPESFCAINLAEPTLCRGPADTL